MFAQRSIPMRRPRGLGRAYVILVIVMLCLSMAGCTLKSKKVTSTGHAYEPHIAWDGSHFGILYYQGATSYSWPQISMLTVDPNGNVVKTHTGLGQISFIYAPFYLSDLVWNSANQQFAFAYSAGKVVYFFRLDANLNVIGSPLQIKFAVVPSEHPYLEDLSLVWNDVAKEYALTYVTRESAYLPGRHDDIYISRISPGGSFVGPYKRMHIVTCPGDCEHTSLTYNTQTGQYALAYFKNDFPNYRVMLGFLGPTGMVSEHEVMAGWKSTTPGDAVRVLYDDASGDYFVVAIKGGELSAQVVNGSGSSVSTYFVRAGGQTYSDVFSVSRYLYPVAHSYLVCASAQNAARCWIATSSGHTASDLVTLSTGSGAPSLYVSPTDNALFLSWIQGSNLYFGQFD